MNAFSKRDCCLIAQGEAQGLPDQLDAQVDVRHWQGSMLFVGM
jgi:hypothetical protein